MVSLHECRRVNRTRCYGSDHSTFNQSWCSAEVQAMDECCWPCVFENFEVVCWRQCLFVRKEHWIWWRALKFDDVVCKQKTWSRVFVHVLVVLVMQSWCHVSSQQADSKVNFLLFGKQTWRNMLILRFLSARTAENVFIWLFLWFELVSHFHFCLGEFGFPFACFSLFWHPQGRKS